MPEANNATNGNMPDLSTLTKVWISETLYGEKTQISYTKEIPELEEAPEQVTERVLDLTNAMKGLDEGCFANNLDVGKDLIINTTALPRARLLQLWILSTLKEAMPL